MTLINHIEFASLGSQSACKVPGGSTPPPSHRIQQAKPLMSKNQNATHIFPICFPASKRLKVEPHWLKSPSSLYKLIKPNLPRECGVFPTIAHVTPDTWHSEETAIVENNHSLFTIKVYSFITAL